MGQVDNFRTIDWSKSISNTGYYTKEAEDILKQIEKITKELT
jgi:hypothetical protein